MQTSVSTVSQKKRSSRPVLSDSLQLWNVPSILWQALISPCPVLVSHVRPASRALQSLSVPVSSSPRFPSPTHALTVPSWGIRWDAVCKEQLICTVWVAFDRTGGCAVYLSSEVRPYIHETWANTGEHQLVPGHGSHMERMTDCAGIVKTRSSSSGTSQC